MESKAGIEVAPIPVQLQQDVLTAEKGKAVGKRFFVLARQHAHSPEEALDTIMVEIFGETNGNDEEHEVQDFLKGLLSVLLPKTISLQRNATIGVTIRATVGLTIT